jgi:hypothetical protein
MSLVNRKKRSGAELADTTRSANLFKGDDAKVEELCQRLKKGPSEVIRQLVSEALIQQEMGQRESAANDGVSRRELAEALDENLRPVRQELGDVKGCLRELASMIGDLQNLSIPKVDGGSSDLGEVLPNIDSNLTLIHEKIAASFDAFVGLTKLIGLKQDRAEARAHAWHQATYALIANIFSWNWIVMDWLKRYVVIPQVALIEPREKVPLVVEAEIKTATSEASKRRTAIQRRLKLPKDEKVEFLSEPRERLQ